MNCSIYRTNLLKCHVLSILKKTPSSDILKCIASQPINVFPEFEQEKDMQTIIYLKQAFMYNTIYDVFDYNLHYVTGHTCISSLCLAEYLERQECSIYVC